MRREWGKQCNGCYIYRCIGTVHLSACGRNVQSYSVVVIKMKEWWGFIVMDDRGVLFQEKKHSFKFCKINATHLVEEQLERFWFGLGSGRILLWGDDSPWGFGLKSLGSNPTMRGVTIVYQGDFQRDIGGAYWKTFYREKEIVSLDIWEKAKNDPIPFFRRHVPNTTIY